MDGPGQHFDGEYVAPPLGVNFVEPWAIITETEAD
jgi:hypothetical protein